MWRRILCDVIFDHLSHLINFAHIACIHCLLVFLFVTTFYADVMGKKRNTPF